MLSHKSCKLCKLSYMPNCSLGLLRAVNRAHFTSDKIIRKHSFVGDCLVIGRFFPVFYTFTCRLAELLQPAVFWLMHLCYLVGCMVSTTIVIHSLGDTCFGVPEGSSQAFVTLVGAVKTDLSFDQTMLHRSPVVESCLFVIL